ncbi:Chaperone protein TorD [Candidatus Entotheonellaceae bacterium PAL068K]
MASSMLGDQDLTAFRYTYYSLFVRLLWQEPAAEFVAALQEGLEARREAAAAVHPRLGEGWQEIGRLLQEETPERVAEEFTTLFLGPFEPQVTPYESYYLTGNLYQGPLIALRSFLKQLGVEPRQQEFAEPEDVLAFELDVMRWLISKQMAAAPQPEAQRRWLERQAALLKAHLLVWAPACAQDMEQASEAHFYRGVGMLLDGFLAMERLLFRDWGTDEIPSLAEARQRYGARPTWQGPTFEVSGE